MRKGRSVMGSSRFGRKEERIFAEHDVFGDLHFFYVDYSDDRGKTWIQK